MPPTGPVFMRVKESEFEWKIRNFSLSEGSYFTPNFMFAGEFWWLDLDPGTCTDGHISLNLVRESSGFPIEVEFAVALKTKEGRKRFERRERYCFEAEGFYDIDEWICTSELRNQMTEFLSFGCLTILLTMRKAESKTTSSACSCCKRSIRGVGVSFHKECVNRAVKCPRCNDVVTLHNRFHNLCPMASIPSESAVSQPSGSVPKNKTLRDLKQMFVNQENCDVVLRIRGQEFSAHKVILMSRSIVFESKFRRNMEGTETGAVDIEDIDPSCFPEFLCFLYYGEIENLSLENVRSLFTAADKYGITDLRTICLAFMNEKLSDEIFLRKSYLDSF